MNGLSATKYTFKRTMTEITYEMHDFVNNTCIELYIRSLLTFHMLGEGIKLFILLLFNVINCHDDISSQNVIQMEYIFLAFVLAVTHVIRVP